VFKKFAAEALGLSDVGAIVQPKDYDKVDADDYLFHEDQEKIHFLIKSRKDEYCFTNLALVHVDGDSAVSSKRTIKRYDYAQHPIGPVTIETGGHDRPGRGAQVQPWATARSASTCARTTWRR
jgi:hypothetical protein